MNTKISLKLFPLILSLVIILSEFMAFGFEMSFKGSPLNSPFNRFNDNSIAINELGDVVFSFQENLLSTETELYLKSSTNESREVFLQANTPNGKIQGKIRALYYSGETLKLAILRDRKLYLDTYTVHAKGTSKVLLKQIRSPKLLSVSLELEHDISRLERIGCCLGTLCCLSIICIPCACKSCLISPYATYDGVKFNEFGELYGKAYITVDNDISDGKLFVESEEKSAFFYVPRENEWNESFINNTYFVGYLSEPSFAILNDNISLDRGNSPYARIMVWENSLISSRVHVLDRVKSVQPYLINPDHTVEADFIYRETTSEELYAAGTLSLLGTKQIPSKRFKPEFFGEYSVYAVSPDQTKVLIGSNRQLSESGTKSFQVDEMDKFLKLAPITAEVVK